MTDDDTLYSALMKLNDKFQASQKWSPEATKWEKTLVAGNLNGFCGFFAKQMPKEALLESDKDARIRELETALEFYANPSDYKAPLTSGFGKLYYDCGEKARAALAPTTSEQGKDE